MSEMAPELPHQQPCPNCGTKLILCDASWYCDDEPCCEVCEHVRTQADVAAH